MNTTLLDTLSQRLSSLSSLVRLQAFYLLRQHGPNTVVGLAKALNQDQGLMVYHLNNLIRAGFVQTSKAGNHRIYFINQVLAQDTLNGLIFFFQGELPDDTLTEPANAGTTLEEGTIEIGDP